MAYTVGFKNNMIRRMVSGASARELSSEVGVAQSTLSRWLRDAGRLAFVPPEPPTAPPSPPRRPEDWTPEEKLQAVLEAASVPPVELGAWLRRKGLHEATLAEWRATMLGALRPAKASKGSPEHKRIRELEKELSRKEKALAETAALLVLRKKAEALWGVEDDATGLKSDSESSD